MPLSPLAVAPSIDDDDGVTELPRGPLKLLKSSRVVRPMNVLPVPGELVNAPGVFVLSVAWAANVAKPN